MEIITMTLYIRKFISTLSSTSLPDLFDDILIIGEGFTENNTDLEI